MTNTATPAMGTNPFSVRTALALVAFGSCLFVLLLWMIGNGFGQGSSNDGGAHADGRGLNGFAAFSELLERRGHPIRHTRTKAAQGDAGLLILTPSASAKAAAIDAAIEQHREVGPTILILPKWQASPISQKAQVLAKAKAGWTILHRAAAPHWADDLSSFGKLDVQVEVVAGAKWAGFGLSGTLPGDAQQTLGSGSVVTLVADSQRQTLIGYPDDGSASASLKSHDVVSGEDDEEASTSRYPLIIVAEPDLYNNYGMADQARAMLALSVVSALGVSAQTPVQFDLTLAGIERDASLLTLAFTPPFLSATLCLLLAAGVVGWRAFLRFGPPRPQDRSIAFGKRALVSNASGLIIRSRRYHLLGAPFAEAARRRLARAIAVPRSADAAAELTAIDRAGANAGADQHAFSQASAKLIHACNERDLVKAAAELHALERTLTR